MTCLTVTVSLVVASGPKRLSRKRGTIYNTSKIRGKGNKLDLCSGRFISGSGTSFGA